jgi:hypothetical protein
VGGGLLISRLLGDSLSTLTDVWPGFEGRVEIVQLVRTGRLWKGGIPGRRSCMSKDIEALGGVYVAFCKQFYNFPSVGKSWQETALKRWVKG